MRGWRRSTSPRVVDTIDDTFADVDVVVTAAIPGDRAEIGIAAMRAGKDVLADKPGATSTDQLAALRAVHEATGKQYLVLFSERLTNAAMVRAYDIVQEGRIGLVVHTVGLGPHTLNLERRPEWFFDPLRYGGILVDIGSHQVDQFLAFTGSRTAEVLTSTVRAHPEHPGVQVLGEVLLATDGATGYTRVDYYTPDRSRATWGDVRFTVVGTEGYLEVRHVDQTVLVVDGEKRETISCTEEPAGWGSRYLDGSLITQDHAFTVTEICLEAQSAARHVPNRAARR